MLVFGSKAIPPGLMESGEYVPYTLNIGSDTHWGPISIDIKPILYIYCMDMSRNVGPKLGLIDWVEQCLHRIVLSLNEEFGIHNPDDLSDLMCTIEIAIYDVVCLYTVPFEYRNLAW